MIKKIIVAISLLSYLNATTNFVEFKNSTNQPNYLERAKNPNMKDYNEMDYKEKEPIDRESFNKYYSKMNNNTNLIPSNVKIKDEKNRKTIEGALVYEFYKEFHKIEQEKTKTMLFSINNGLKLTMEALEESLKDGYITLELNQKTNEKIYINNELIGKNLEEKIENKTLYRWYYKKYILIKEDQLIALKGDKNNSFEKDVYLEVYYDKTNHFVKFTIKNTPKYNEKYIYVHKIFTKDIINQNYIIKMFKSNLNIEL